MQDVLIDGQEYVCDQTVKFNYIYTGHDHPFQEDYEGTLNSFFQTVDGTTYIDVQLCRVGRRNIFNVSKIFSVNQIVRGSFVGVSHANCPV
jgi:hypothetical protein